MPAKPMLFALLIAAPLMACVASDETVSETGQEIVGGTTATVTDFPTVVALQHGAGNMFCSGVLVDKDWVLTTASCFDSTAATQARIGDANLNDGTTSGLTITVATVYKHPQFSLDDTVWRHDVAVLKLAQSVTDRRPTAIRRDATPIGAAITQAGFGTNNNSGGGIGALRSLTTTNLDCAGANDAGITNQNLLCFNAADGTGSCAGDGGAPAFVTGTGGARIVAGVGSGGTGSSCTQGLDIYTSLLPELSFIDTYVPVVTTPPTTTDPPTMPPTDPQSGSGSGSGSGRDPDGKDGHGPATAVGCSAGGGAGAGVAWLVVLGAALLRIRRRSRKLVARDEHRATS